MDLNRLTEKAQDVIRGAQALASRRPAMSDRPSRGSTARHAITCGQAVENRRAAAMVKETANLRQSGRQPCRCGPAACKPPDAVRTMVGI